MKKVLFILALIISFSSSVFAEVILAPQWSEFCPVSFLTVPSTVKTKDKKYWYERRVQFEASLARCNAYTGEDLKDCYNQVREAEQNKNKIWDAKVKQNYADYEMMQENNKRMERVNLLRDLINKI